MCSASSKSQKLLMFLLTLSAHSLKAGKFWTTICQETRQRSEIWWLSRLKWIKRLTSFPSSWMRAAQWQGNSSSISVHRAIRPPRNCRQWSPRWSLSVSWHIYSYNILSVIWSSWSLVFQGERVLRVSEMCEKLESKYKEALSSLSSAADSETSVTECQVPLVHLTVSLGQTSEFQKSQKLLGRMKTAVLVRDTLKKQKQILRQENQQLRLQVHQQMDGMSINDNTINGHHTLLTVLQASSIRVLPSPPRSIHKQFVQNNLEAPVK